MNKIGSENIINKHIEDKFLEEACIHAEVPYEQNYIEIETCDDTLGDVMRWMAAYDEEDFLSVNKDNYKTIHNNFFDHWDNNVIVGGGELCYYMMDKGDIRALKSAIGRHYPLDTKWTKIISDYADENWDHKVHVISYYTGYQGLLTITVFDVDSNRPIFSMTSLEMFGYFRSK